MGMVVRQQQKQQKRQKRRDRRNRRVSMGKTMPPIMRCAM
jgi:hypothetical protein